MMPENMEHFAAIVACQQLTARFYAALDASDFEQLAQAFLPAGIWHRQGKVLQGPTEVLAALANRPTGRTTAHLVQNLVVDFSGGDTATVRYMTLVYRHDASPPVSPPAPLGLPLAISLNEDHLKRDEDGHWRILLKKSQRHFAS